MSVITPTITASFCRGDLVITSARAEYVCDSRRGAINALIGEGFSRDAACEAVARALVDLTGRP